MNAQQQGAAQEKRALDYYSNRSPESLAIDVLKKQLNLMEIKLNRAVEILESYGERE